MHDVFHADAANTPHRRIMWSPKSDDLHINLVDLRGNEEIEDHVNEALDVLLTCLAGDGTLVIDGESVSMVTGSVALVPKGARRAVIAGPDGMRYTTCHRARGGLMPSVKRNPERG